MKLIVGLGNPGGRYDATRHNVGFMALDAFADAQQFYGWTSRFKGLHLSAQAKGERVVLLKPQTFMNLSGESVQAAAAFYRVALEDLVVVHDDIDFEPGRLAVKIGGGHGGHNGLRSIIQHLGPDFVRLRLGVGRPPHNAANHVLSAFSEDEMDGVEEMVGKSAKALAWLLFDGTKAAQNKVNKRLKKKKAEPDKESPNTTETEGAAKPSSEAVAEAQRDKLPVE